MTKKIGIILVVLFLVVTVVPTFVDYNEVSADPSANITFHWVDPVQCASVTGWVDVDLDSLLSIDSSLNVTGVILHIHQIQDDWNTPFGLRKNGSTDSRTDVWMTAAREGPAHMWAMVGVDSNRIFEYYSSMSFPQIYIVGYTTTGVGFFTNAIQLSITPGSWTDVDVSAHVPNNTVGLIFELQGGSPGEDCEFGLRVNGSTDTMKYDIYAHYSFGGMVGCDENQVFEAYLENTDATIWLLGYITSGIEFRLNALHLSALEFTFKDLPALPAIATGGFYYCLGNQNYGVRKNGSSESLSGESYHAYAFVECDADGIVEAYAYDDDLYLIAWPTGGVYGNPSDILADDPGIPSATANLDMFHEAGEAGATYPGEDLPFAPFIYEQVSTLGVSISVFWVLLCIAISVFLGILMYVKTGGNMFATVIPPGFVWCVFAVIAGGLVPWWAPIVYIIAACTVMVFRRVSNL